MLNICQNIDWMCNFLIKIYISKNKMKNFYKNLTDPKFLNGSILVFFLNYNLNVIIIYKCGSKNKLKQKRIKYTHIKNVLRHIELNIAQSPPESHS